MILGRLYFFYIYCSSGGFKELLMLIFRKGMIW